ncbi:MAG TPA: DUF4340 domain-containing protein [Thermoanaerobaculia bacterium]|jgi:hypothetical protein|nr:DUF4340 domain-containing protein [Thermoanaerobaculia bacterium]
MKPRTLLVLLVVVLGLGAFIWFYERKLPSSEERTELQKKVLEIEKGDVTAVTIQSAKAGTIRLERIEPPKPAKKDGEAATEPAEWRMTRPLAARADTFAVERLLDAVSSLEKTRTLEDVDRKDVGLDKPRATLRLATKEGETVLELGADVPPGGSLVAGIKGEKGAYVVSDSILTDLERPPGDWRDKLMFRGDREAVQRIALTAGAAGGPVVLAKRANGFWIEKPIADRADSDLVDGLLSDLTGLTAERFVDASRPLAELGLAPPREAVDVVFRGVAAPVRIELGGPVTGEAAPEGQTSGELSYARVGNTIFEVRTRLAESARRSPADWRALQLSALAVHDVESATVRDDRTEVKLTRSGTDWKRGETLISYLPVSDLLFAVTGARADRLLTPQEAQASGADLAKPVLTFNLHSKEAGDETLTLYPPLKEGVPARASGRDVVLRLPSEAFREIQEKLRGVRAAKAEK